jgi:hypothetical protein
MDLELSEILDFDIDESELMKSFSSISDTNDRFDLASYWKSSEYVANVLAGTRIALYDLEKELGSGKFGKVKIGRHISGR